MGNIYEALRRAELEQPGIDPLIQQTCYPYAVPQPLTSVPVTLDQVAPLQPAAAMDARLVAIMDGKCLGAEQFRVLSIRLIDLQNQSAVKKILVTSSTSGEGKSVIAANLAASLARNAQQKVLLLGGDLRCLALNRLLGCNGLPGLSDYLLGDGPLTNYLYRVDPLPLWFMPGGSSSIQALQLLESARLKELLDVLASAFDWVIVDSSPLLPLADSIVWARMVDGTLIVVREGKTPKKLLQKAVESLGRASLLGIVVNECRAKEDSEYYQSGKGS